MIFLSVGTQLPFDRMVRLVDQWAARNPSLEIYGQILNGDFSPRHFQYSSHLASEVFVRHFREADLIVSHAGMGNIITSLELQKPIIVVPRRSEFREHRNDHQLATVEKFRSYESVFAVENLGELDSCYHQICSQANVSSQEQTSRQLTSFIEAQIKAWFP